MPTAPLGVNAQKPPAEIVTELYLAAYSRLPTPPEQAATVEYLEAAEDKRKAAEDVLWTILNSREFLFNH